MSEPNPVDSATCERAKKIRLPSGCCAGADGEAPLGSVTIRPSVRPCSSRPSSPAGVAMTNVERGPTPTAGGIAETARDSPMGALWQATKAATTSARRGRQVTLPAPRESLRRPRLVRRAGLEAHGLYVGVLRHAGALLRDLAGVGTRVLEHVDARDAVR